MLKETSKGKEWKDKDYTVKWGQGAQKKDIYHVYHSGQYVAQVKSLKDAEDFIAKNKK